MILSLVVPDYVRMVKLSQQGNLSYDVARHSVLIAVHPQFFQRNDLSGDPVASLCTY